MHRYFLKIPWWMRTFFPSYTWRIRTAEKVLFLTFDDGPHPTITPWVLDELKKVNAKATFFCIGKNIEANRGVYQRILAEGHAVGNHTYTHVNGWKTPVESYVGDAKKAQAVIASSLFRPPYGRIKSAQAKALKTAFVPQPCNIIMWTVLSADFDSNYKPEQCVQNVVKRARAGDIIVFHDSQKAEQNLRGSLVETLTALQKAGYRFEKISMG